MTETHTTELSTLAEAERAQLEARLGRLDRLARLMDDQFRLPVIGYRVGLDPIIGLIPGGGDWATWVVGVYIFWESLRLDAPRQLLGRMTVNLMVDLIVGYVPGLGDAFDAVFKANRKNVDLLLDFYGAKATGRRGEDRRLRLPDDLPEHLEKQRKKSKLVRYLAGSLVVLMLLGLAAVPIVVLWWLFS